MRISLRFALAAALAVGGLTLPSTPAKAQSPSPYMILRAPARPASLIGNLIYQDGWSWNNSAYGLYSFLTSSPNLLNEIKTSDDLQCSYGSGVYENMFYGVAGDLSYIDYQWIMGEKLVSVNMDTKELKTTDLDDPTKIAMVSAQDRNTGIVYGQFLCSDYKTRELGTIEYPSLKRTSIAPVTRYYAAMAVDNDGQLFGIGGDGNLYRINTTNGEETLVGSTGVSIAVNDESTFNKQSACVDPATNTMYWAAITSDGKSILYTVDTSTGAATEVAAFNKVNEFVGLAAGDPIPVDAAPGKASDVSASFLNGSTTGTISFTVPTKTYSNTDLTADGLKYYVVLGHDTLATAATEPGKSESVSVTSTEGNKTFNVIIGNNAGLGEKARISCYVGFDEPKPVTNLKANLDNADAVTNLSWTAPTSTINGGYLGNLTYDIYQYTKTDTTLVAQGVPDNEYVVDMPKTVVTKYNYAVEAVNGQKHSSRTVSGPVVYGTGKALPYEEDFDEDGDHELWTTYDANNDGNTWEWSISYNGVMEGPQSSGNDDWLFSPPVRLQAGKKYTLSLSGYNYSYSDDDYISLKAYIGGGPNVDAMKQLVIDTAKVYSNRDTLSQTFTVSADGDYNVGIEDISGEWEGKMRLETVRIASVSTELSPDSVQNLSVVSAPNGDKQAIFKFNAPDKTISGKQLTNIDKISIMRGYEVVKEINNPAPGEAITCTDEPDGANGEYTYTITASNADGDGPSVKRTLYVGEDIPYPPTNVVVNDPTATTLHFQWQGVDSVGINGGVVCPDSVWYNIYTYKGDSLIKAATTRNLEADVTTDNMDEGNQNSKYYVVVACNKAGEPDDSWISAFNYGLRYPIGRPYTLPFADSFTDNSIFRSVGGDMDFSNESVDEGGYSFECKPFFRDGTASYTSGKISLKGAVNPELAFYYKGEPGKKVTIEVKARKSDGTYDVLKTIDLSKQTGESKWIEDKVSLADYIDQRYVCVRFDVTSEQGASTLLDNFRVSDIYEYDLHTSMTVSPKITKGRIAHADVTVKNIGDNPVANYQVLLTGNGEVVADSTDAVALQPLEVRTYHFIRPTSSVNDNAISKIDFKATVNYEDDLNNADNTANGTTDLKVSDGTTVGNLQADGQTGSVKLTWNTPAAKERVIDDFESYSPWSIAFGDWTLIDGNGAPAGPVWGGLTYPHQGEPFAFIIFNPENIDPDNKRHNPSLEAHSGTQYAAVPREVQGTAYYYGDNWLISPQLSGEPQTVSFYVHNVGMTDNGGVYTNYPNDYQVLYTTGDPETQNFVVLQDTVRLTTGEWVEVSLDVPDSTRYFAIHEVTVPSKDNLPIVFGVDDATFTPGFGRILGYNIYCDGKLVGHTDTDGTTEFTVNSLPDGNHSFSVTVRYPEGESLPVDATASVTTAIDKVIADGQPHDIYSLGGVLVRKNALTTDGLPAGVYIINGKKFIVK